MKSLITVILLITATAFASQAQSATIAGIENVTLLDRSGTVNTSSHQFVTATTAAAGPVYTGSEPVVPSGYNPAESVKDVLTDSGTNLTATWILSGQSGAYLDITFGDRVTGNDDLVFFFSGVTDLSGNVKITFDLDINADGIIDPIGNNIMPFVPLDADGFATTGTDVEGTNFTVTAALIDLSAFGLATDQELNTFRIYMANNGTFPALSAVGYIAAVPLPLPVVLLASGLGVLGAFGRRKKH